MSLSNTVKSIQNIMRQDVGLNGDAQRIEQMGWLLFLKIFDDREQEVEFMDGEYKSPIPEKYRWRNWASDDEGITGDELIDFINDLFKIFKDISSQDCGGRDGVIRQVFTDAHNFMKSGQLLRQVINKINEIDFNNSDDRHTFGDIYEHILKELQSAGNSGEFYTPRAVTQFMTDIIDPKIGEKVFDPACGTGGFLTCAIENMKKHITKSEDLENLKDSIFGVEKKQLPHILCTTNLILHGIDVPSNVRHDNTLSKPLNDYSKKDKVDVILTNPPFGGTEEPGIENNFPADVRTRETADLFLALIVSLLKDKGRAAVVLPDGSLFGEGVKTNIKKKLLKECNLHTIVRLPNGVFNPYTGISTNLLFFTKGQPTKEIWYYEHPYPEGYKSYSKTKPMKVSEFDVEKSWWDNREENSQAWKVSIEDIEKNGFNLDIKNPSIKEEINEYTVDELIDKISSNLKESTDILQSIKEELK
ncbi:MAG: class I SAM-dependent DNA methyltransferase [Alphaproteobacteria bacterium]|nr:class I SAM-dependent DNA methyltransferase [Alphaproteobacteria bacterium]